MPKQRRSQGHVPARNAGAPAARPRLIEGGVRPLPVEVGDGSEPSVALWVDGQSGMVLAYKLIDRRQSPDRGASEALAALEEALESPLLDAGAPGLIVPGAPQRGRAGGGTIVVRTDRQLAALAQLRLARLHAVVEAATELPMFDMAFAEMAQTVIGGSDEDDEPFEWEIEEALLPPLFAAAAEYARHEPWAYMLDHPPFAVALGARSPLPGVETLYGSIMGAGGEVFGVAYYLSLDEYREAVRAGAEMEQEGAGQPLDEKDMGAMVEQLRRMGAPVDSVPPDLLRGMLQQFADAAATEPPRQESLVCFFDDEENTDPSYLEWLEDRDVTFADDEEIPVFLRTGHDADPRDPSAEEVRAITLALSATNAFLAAHRRMLRRRQYAVPRDALRHAAQVHDGEREVTVEVTWPAPGFDVETEMPPEPAR